MLAAEKVPTRDFERCVYFEGCMPIEEMARRGRDTLAFGPMRPVGLTDPRTGRRPFAVVQARQDNAAATLYNLVGFQTKMTYPGAAPGLAHDSRPAERRSSCASGACTATPSSTRRACCEPTLQLRQRPTAFLAGQLIGVEGYVESAASGILAGLNAVRLLDGRAAASCRRRPTALGSLIAYVTDRARREFQPMNANYGLFPAEGVSGRGRDRRAALAAARRRMLRADWLTSAGLVERDRRAAAVRQRRLSTRVSRARRGSLHVDLIRRLR